MKVNKNHGILCGVVIFSFSLMALAWNSDPSRSKGPKTSNLGLFMPGIFKKDTCVDGKPDAKVDDRHDWYTVNDHLADRTTTYQQSVLQNGEAVGMLFPCMAAFEAYQEDFITHGQREMLAEDHPFGKQIVPISESQTAFLIREDIIATAGHWPIGEPMEPCTEDDELVVVFGLVMHGPVEAPTQTGLDGSGIQSVRIKRQLLWDHGYNKSDYAVYQLACTVDDIPPVELDLQRDAQNGDEIYSWGHPKGLPLKFVDDAKVINRLLAPRNFQSPLDALPGSSGSPVFNAETHKVVGILSGGVRANYSNKIPREEIHNVYHRQGCACPKENFGGVHFTRVWRIKYAATAIDSVLRFTRSAPPCL